MINIRMFRADSNSYFEFAVPRVHQTDTLGGRLSDCGDTQIACDFRLEKASRLFYKQQHLYLGSKASHPLSRWWRFNSRILPSATYAAGGWQWDVTLFRTLRKWENGFVRRIWRFKPRPDEEDDPGKFMRRTAKFLQTIRRRNGWPSLAERVLYAFLRHALRCSAVASPDLRLS